MVKEAPTCIITIKIITHIFAAETVTCICAAETFNCIITTETVTCIIMIEAQNLHNCKRHCITEIKSVSCIVPTETAELTTQTFIWRTGNSQRFFSYNKEIEGASKHQV